MTDIYVHRNPFCKSYSNYRVTVFNLFRKTPGYTEDVIIDSTGPSNSEKKQLIDRVPEPLGVPIMKPPPEDEMPPPPVPPKVVKAIDATELYQSPPRTSLQRSKSGKGTGSHRKKKTPKRRVVELTQAEMDSRAAEPSYGSSDPPPDEPVRSAEVPTSITRTETSVESALLLEEPREDLSTSGDPAKKPLPPIDTDVKAHASPEFDVSSDLYKKKIEALRQDFGNTWLSALGDEGWDAKSVTSYTSPALRPTLPRTPSQGIVSGGRTLG
jgi:hypothetical protein